MKSRDRSLSAGAFHSRRKEQSGKSEGPSTWEGEGESGTRAGKQGSTLQVEELLVRHTVNISREPDGEAYRALLRFGAQRCGSFELVLRDELDLSPEGSDLLESLTRFERQRRRLSEWPGTRLLDGLATVVEFDLTSESLGFLLAAAGGLYSWTQPELPEDLCLLRTDGTPWLATIAHERDGYFEFSDEELSDLLTTLPELAPFLTSQPDES